MPTTVPDVYVKHEDKLVPLRSLDWIVLRPCRCVEGVTYAYSTDQEAAWKEFFDDRPERTRMRSMLKKGWSIALMDRRKATEAFLGAPTCLHGEG